MNVNKPNVFLGFISDVQTVARKPVNNRNDNIHKSKAQEVRRSDEH